MSAIRGVSMASNSIKNSLVSSQRAFAQGGIKRFGERDLQLTSRAGRRPRWTARQYAARAEGAEDKEDKAIEELSGKIRWLPPIGREDYMYPEGSEEDKTTMTLPCFPLGIAYLPGTDQVLNIFEPRYRQMYNDILFNGSRRFVVPMVSQVDGRFAEVAAVFYLDDLKEVSEQTEDRVKYVCSHKVVGRVKINHILNPAVWRDRSAYLKVDAEDMVDADVEEDHTVAEASLSELLKAVMVMQVHLDQDVRLEVPLVDGKVDVSPTSDGYWFVVNQWQEFCHQRLLMVQAKGQQKIQELLMPYVQKDDRTPTGQYVVNFEKLPEDVKAKLKTIQSGSNEELQELMSDPYMPFQLLLQADRHHERLVLLEEMIEEEHKRLQARAALKNLFKSE